MKVEVDHWDGCVCLGALCIVGGVATYHPGLAVAAVGAGLVLVGLRGAKTWAFSRVSSKKKQPATEPASKTQAQA